MWGKQQVKMHKMENFGQIIIFKLKFAPFAWYVFTKRLQALGSQVSGTTIAIQLLKILNLVHAWWNRFRSPPSALPTVTSQYTSDPWRPQTNPLTDQPKEHCSISAVSSLWLVRLANGLLRSLQLIELKRASFLKSFGAELNFEVCSVEPCFELLQVLLIEAPETIASSV